MASRLLIRIQLQSDRRGEWRAALRTSAGCARNPTVDFANRDASARGGWLGLRLGEAPAVASNPGAPGRHSHPKLLILVPKFGRQPADDRGQSTTWPAVRIPTAHRPILGLTPRGWREFARENNTTK